jgi:hypothetical protein
MHPVGGSGANRFAARGVLVSMHNFWADTLADDHRNRLMADARRADLVRAARAQRPSRDAHAHTVRWPRPWRWLRRRRSVIATT